MNTHDQHSVEAVGVSDVTCLLRERDGDYGDAWLLAGEVVDYLHDNGSYSALNPLIISGYFYAWITILAKLIRIIRSPYHLDSWRDIIGYATLVVNHIDSRKASK